MESKGLQATAYYIAKTGIKSRKEADQAQSMRSYEGGNQGSSVLERQLNEAQSLAQKESTFRATFVQ